MCREVNNMDILVKYRLLAVLIGTALILSCGEADARLANPSLRRKRNYIHVEHHADESLRIPPNFATDTESWGRSVLSLRTSTKDAKPETSYQVKTNRKASDILELEDEEMRSCGCCSIVVGLNKWI